jgi:hypothetical protein
MEDLSDGIDDTSLLAKLENPQPRPPRPAPEPINTSAKMVGKADDLSVADWLKNSFSGASVKISVHRTAPETWVVNGRGRQISGVLDTYDEFFDEDFLKERYGGGKFQIKIQQLSPNGKWQFAGARTIKIAGDPKITNELFELNNPKENETTIPLAQNDDVTKQAMSMTQMLTQQALERAERAEARMNDSANKGMDPTMLVLLTEPFKLQIQTLSNLLAEKEKVIAEKDRQIHELSSRKPDTTLQDTLIGKMYDGESSKLESIRTQFESERRMLLQSHADEIKRIEGRFDIDKQFLHEAHRREIKTLETNYEGRIKALETSFEGRLDSKDTRIKDLERQITRSDAELSELRAKKDKSPIDQMRDLVQIREAFSEVLGSGKDDEDEPSTAEKIIGAIAENPIVRGIGERIASGQAPVQQNPAPSQRVQPRRVAPKPPIQSASLPAPASSGLPPGISQTELSGAIMYMEAAIQSGTDPAMFAQSVRNSIPKGIIDAIRDQGIDAFLDGAKIDGNSPLSSQVGRSWIRRVAKILLTGDESSS